MKKRRMEILVKLISVLLILFWMIKNFKFYLYTGGGLAFQNLLDLGVPENLAINKAKSMGYLYLFLMYNGYQIPILGLLLVSIKKLFKSNSKKKNKLLIISPFLFFLWGTTFLSFSYTIVKNDNFIVLFLSALPIWLLIIIGYLIIYWMIKLIIHIVNKRKQKNYENDGEDL